MVQSPEGREIELTEKSKMHYMDQETFWAVMADIWKRNSPCSGMTASQFRDSLLAREAPKDLNAVSLAKPASIRFLEMKGGRRVYMKKVIDIQQTIQKMAWPYQNNRTSIAGGSRALFLGAQTNRGLQQGCVVKEDLPGTLPGSLAESACISGELLQGITISGNLCDAVVRRAGFEQAQGLPQS